VERLAQKPPRAEPLWGWASGAGIRVCSGRRGARVACATLVLTLAPTRR